MRQSTFNSGSSAGNDADAVGRLREYRRQPVGADLTRQPSIPESSPPLRVGLLLDDLVVPSWIAAVAASLLTSPTLQLATVVLNGSGTARINPDYSPRPNPLRLSQFYMYLERRVFHATPDALEPVDLSEQLGSCPVIRSKPLFDDAVFRFDERDRERLQQCDIDVLLLFWSGLPADDVLPLARHGVWFFRDHELVLLGHAPLGFWEVLDQDRVTTQSLEARQASAPGQLTLHRHHGPTHLRSITLARNNLLWKAPSIVSRKLEQLSRERSLDGVQSPAESADGARRPSAEASLPSNGTMLKKIGAHAGRFLQSQIERRTHFEQWAIAYRYGGGDVVEDGSLVGYRWLVPPHDRFWADPFPVQTAGGDFLFFEQGIDPGRRGHLCVAPIDASGLRDEPTVILQPDYHVSYPFVFSWQGEQYLLPEMQDAGRVDLYKFDPFPHRISHFKTLLRNVRACDATLLEAGGRWWMFVAIAADATWNVDELHVFHADTPLGPWRAHEKNPVKSDVRSSRPAGAIFERDGRRYRPAQDCSHRYGYAIRVHEITELTESSYAEVEVNRILPRWSPDALAIHTMNRAGALSVFDGRVRRRV